MRYRRTRFIFTMVIMRFENGLTSISKKKILRKQASAVTIMGVRVEAAVAVGLTVATKAVGAAAIAVAGTAREAVVVPAALIVATVSASISALIPAAVAATVAVAVEAVVAVVWW